MADDKLEVTHLMGKKLDKPIILKWKSETKKNKMEQVAAMFGKSLGEEFTAVIWDVMQKWKFTDEGLKVKYLDGDWHKSDSLLRCLLTGEAKIVEDEE